MLGVNWKMFTYYYVKTLLQHLYSPSVSNFSHFIYYGVVYHITIHNFL